MRVSRSVWGPSEMITGTARGWVFRIGRYRLHIEWWRDK